MCACATISRLGDFRHPVPVWLQELFSVLCNSLAYIPSVSDVFGLPSTLLCVFRKYSWGISSDHFSVS